MKFIKNLALATIAGLLTLNTLAATLDIHGVKLDDNTEVHGTKLQLIWLGPVPADWQLKDAMLGIK